jgi:hypothetical protein
MKIIAFNVNNWSFRGTETAIYDYAYYNECILNNKSIIVYPKFKTHKHLDNTDIFKKFTKQFECIEYNNIPNQEYVDLTNILHNKKCTHLYFIKYGTKDNIYIPNIIIINHCVYTTNEPHGDIYGAVSDTVATNNTHNIKYPVVPHIITQDSTTDDLRKILNIPQDAIVFGRHGGSDTFDIFFVKNVISFILTNYTNIYFIFAVRPDILQDINHPRLIFSKPFTDSKIKRMFINTCDAMIHASSLGESFGISILEFCKANKPAITFIGKLPGVPFYNNQHLKNLNVIDNNNNLLPAELHKCYTYDSPESLLNILMNFKKSQTIKNIDSVCEPFTPINVINKFNIEFIL